MPSKNRKKKKKKKPIDRQPLWQFEINFDDVTMVATDGQYDEVKKLVEDDENGIGTHEWTVKSRLTISSLFGKGDLMLDFRSDRSIWIIDYASNSQDSLHNPDISCLMQWSQLAGWQIPQPTEALVLSNVRFWKQMWETLLIDSNYLDKRFGERISLRKTVDVEDDYGDMEEV